jgi:hypothetical protein
LCLQNTWTPEQDMGKLEAEQKKFLRVPAGASWKDHSHNSVIRGQLGETNIRRNIERYRFQWGNRLEGMGHTWLPKKVYYYRPRTKMIHLVLSLKMCLSGLIIDKVEKRYVSNKNTQKSCTYPVIWICFNILLLSMYQWSRIEHSSVQNNYIVHCGQKCTKY